MGNAIAKKFDVPKDYTATAGHHQLWKIWPGKSKDTGDLVSIWAFDKSDLTKRKNNPITDKAVLEQIFQIMKKDYTILKESTVCCSVVRFIETIEESKTAIVFTTERIICSLGDVVSRFQNIEGGSNSHNDFFEDDGSVSEIEISKGLLSLAEGLQYLHTVQRKLHLNITPESVVIASGGQWKLCGFGFNLTFIQGDQQRLASPYFLKALSIATSGQVRLEPDLRYSGPECTDGGFNPPGIRYLTPASDVFSLGLLAYEIFRLNLKDIPTRSTHRPVLALTSNDALQHHHALDALKTLDFSFLPSGVSQLVVGLLQLNVAVRLSTSDIINNQYFVTGSLALLNTIESMHSRDVGTQSSQLISLQGQLTTFSPRILFLIILPAVCKLCLLNAALWVYAMPLHVFLAQQMPQDRYQQYAGPTMAVGLAINNPTETMQAFLSNIHFIVNMFDREYFQAHVVTLFCNALEKQNIFLQSLAMEKLAEDSIRLAFDADSLASKLMPKLCKEACKNPEPNIKIQALYILSLFSARLDQDFIARNILPSLKYITDNEKNGSVSMCVIGNYEALSESLGAEYIAMSILPSIQPMLVDKSLDKQQFELVVNLVKSLLKRLFDARTKELNMPAVSVGEMLGNTSVDPFSAAKNLISISKRNSAAIAAGNNPAAGPSYTTSTATLSPSSGSLGAPPPPPKSAAPDRAPPPPPSKPAPALPASENTSSYSAATPSYGTSSSVPMGSSNSNGGGLFGSITSAPNSGLGISSPISAYQSDFDKNKSVAPTTAPLAPAYNSSFPNSIPLEPISNASLSSANGAATSATSTAPVKATTGFSWFSSSSKAASTPAKVDVAYQPPVVPMPAVVDSFASSSSGAASSGVGGGAGGVSAIDDMDDFLSSFGKSSNSSNSMTSAQPASFSQSTFKSAPLSTQPPFVVSAPSNTTAGAGLLSIEEQIRQTQAQIAQLSAGQQSSQPLSGSGSGMSGFNSFTPPPVAPSTVPTTAGYSGAPMGQQQQMFTQHPTLQPQYNQPAFQPQNAFSQPPPQQQQYMAPPQQSYGVTSVGQPQQPYSAQPFATQQQSTQQFGSSGRQYSSSGPQYGGQLGGQQQQQQQQQPVNGFAPQQQQQQQGYGMNGFGGNPSGAAVGASGYSSQSYNSQYLQQQPPMQQNLNGNRIGTLPPSTGYQPPSAYQAPQPAHGLQQPYQPQSQQQNKSSINSAFDFLN